MKLVAAPLLIRVSRQSHNAEFPQTPLLVVDRLCAPFTIHDRITKRATVRRSNLATVVNFLIAIIVTLRTRREGARRRTEAHALMFGMTINTADTRRFMRFDHSRGERLCAMTRSTSLFHVS
jgi:hypothetical protein